MDALLTPDYGLIFWTIVNFLLLVFLLGKFAWKPIIGALEDRENKIAQDKKDAQSARDEAQKIKEELEKRLAGIAREAQEKMAQVEALAQTQKEAIIAEAKHSSKVMIDQATVEIEAQKKMAVADIKKEVSDIALAAAAKVSKVKLDAQADSALISDMLNTISK
ncbi:F-type H+-transporting ATPase subunit b [Elusimicrobium posterum]|uniref:F0F1 ATP synthase subunit B n=1 Tax=Elusimicrobium posterum TaxID=3116653 RepID=UPI003C727EEC